MFQTQLNGYDKKSVDEYISKLKNEIMEQKLSILDNEQKYLDYREKRAELETKEKNLYKAVKAFQDAQKIKDEGAKTLYALKLEQLSLLYKKAENLINSIYLRHPEIEKDMQIKALFIDFEQLLNNTIEKDNYSSVLNTPISTENDSMRLLLSKMQDYRMTKEKTPKEVRFERTPTETRIQIKPICADSPSHDVDAFLTSKPTEEEGKYFKKESENSKFNIEEAINPKEDLETIMKAFDFFNNDEN